MAGTVGKAGTAVGRSTLPRPKTSLIGRERELAEVAALLREQDVRLLTITGAGGTGKTRFAIALADQAPANQPVYWVDLATIEDAALLPSTIGRTIGMREGGPIAAIDHLIDALRTEHLTLFLDNMEHLLDGKPALVRMLDEIPGLRVIATSRSPLHISGEYEYQLHPLQIPAPDDWHDPDLLMAAAQASPAVTLLVDRMKMVRPGFELTPENAPQLIDICKRLDGMPLAIELAAARGKVLSPAALLERLDHALDLLTTGPGDAPLRLQSLREAIRWSEELLTEEGKRRFRRLGVFVGQVSITGAAAVNPEDDETALIDGLTELVDFGLIYPSDDRFGQSRFRLLDTVRAYALEQLAASGEEDVTRQRLAERMLQAVEAGEANFTGPGEAAWAAQVEDYLPTVRQTLAWAIRSGQALTVNRLVTGLWSLWSFHGRLNEGARLLDQALAMPGAETIPLPLRARLLWAAGLNAWAAGRLAEARDFHTRSLRVSRGIDDRDGAAIALMLLANVAWYEGDFTQMEALARESLETATAAFDPAWTGSTLTVLGIALMRQGRLDEARVALERALETLERAGFTRSLVWTLQNLADLDHIEGNIGASAQRHLESLVLGMEAEDAWMEFEDFSALVLLGADAGLWTDAARLMGAAERLQQRHGVLARQGRQVDAAVRQRIRESLGERKFEAAVAAGAALTPETAVGVAQSVARALGSGRIGAQEARPAGDRQPARSPSPLTERETEIMTLVAQGKSDREIADELFISHATARTHVRNILVKLSVPNRAGAVAMAMQEGWI